MRFEVVGPAFADEGDEVLIADAIRHGDLVWFDRIEPHKVVMRAVASAVKGAFYRIERGSEPDVIKLVAELSRDINAPISNDWSRY